MEDEVEFAIRELAVAINHLMDVVDANRLQYDKVPDSLHHAVVSLMKEIAAIDWEVVS